MTQFVDYMRSTDERQAGYTKGLNLPDVVLVEPEVEPIPPVEPEPAEVIEAAEAAEVESPAEPKARSRRPPTSKE